MKKEFTLSTKTKYPHYLNWSTRIWVLKEGDLVEKDNKQYKVIQVIRPIIKGHYPKIVLEENVETT